MCLLLSNFVTYLFVFHLQKETANLVQDAKKKKEQFLAAQSQANDTQAVAMQTKQEAEKLRSEAEEAEFRAAAAASMRHTPSTNGHPTQAVSAPAYSSQPSAPSYNTGQYNNSQPPVAMGGAPAYSTGQYNNLQPPVQSMGGAPAYSVGQYHNSQPPAVSTGGGLEGQSYGGMNGDYNAGVMGGGSGGLSSIPSPAAGNDPSRIPSPTGGEDPYDNPF
jgi:hypothetical protein